MNYISYDFPEISKMISIFRIFIIIMCTYYTINRVLDNKNFISKRLILECIINLLGSVICVVISDKIDYTISIIYRILFISYMYKIMTKMKWGESIIITTICLGINYIIYTFSIIISFVPNELLNLNNNYINLIIIVIIYTSLLYVFLKIKKFKRGFAFLKEKVKDDYFDILILNISISVLIVNILLKNYDISLREQSFFALIISAIIMFITIQKTLTMYYKHKLLVADLEETKTELANKEKEIEKLEAENLEISKTSHTISHKIKSLEFKINELEMKREIADEIDLSDRINKIAKEYYKKSTVIELDKTNIEEIDDMLKYMQSECAKNDIEFELQLNGNINYMSNNIIPKEKLETLLADHIKDAIIAVNHSDNINRSILVRLGLIDGIYSVYIYDSGIEFKQETLSKLGKEPITTHKDEGGTGMGFMNTFDTLHAYKASMTINEIDVPNKDNYTKAIIIKFDNKNNFKIDSYRKIAITQ